MQIQTILIIVIMIVAVQNIVKIVKTFKSNFSSSHHKRNFSSLDWLNLENISLSVTFLLHFSKMEQFQQFQGIDRSSPFELI